MGGCATKPVDSDGSLKPVPRNDETPDSPKKAEGETVPQENNTGGEIEKEEPLVDLSEPAQGAPKNEGPSSEPEVVHEESKASESSEVTAKPTEDKVETVNETKEEEEEKKKEVTEVAENKEVEVAVAVTGSNSEDKSDAPLVTM